MQEGWAFEKGYCFISTHSMLIYNTISDTAKGTLYQERKIENGKIIK